MKHFHLWHGKLILVSINTKQENKNILYTLLIFV